MYDINELRARIKKRKKAFLLKALVLSLLMLTALVLIALNIHKAVTFISIISALLLLLATHLTVQRDNPTTIFSRELRGVNIKEEEYVSRRTPGLALKWHGGGGRTPPQPFAPNTGANKKQYHPRLGGRVYLLHDSGDISEISGLTAEHVDIYEEGDALIKYAGTKYPIVLSRAVERQPCPICGEINDMTAVACRACGLGIIKES